MKHLFFKWRIEKERNKISRIKTDIENKNSMNKLKID